MVALPPGENVMPLPISSVPPIWVSFATDNTSARELVFTIYNRPSPLSISRLRLVLGAESSTVDEAGSARKTSLSDVGTVPALQFAAVFQSPPFALVH